MRIPSVSPALFRGTVGVGLASRSSAQNAGSRALSVSRGSPDCVGILLNLAGDLVEKCFEFPRAWRQTVGFVTLRSFGGRDNGPSQPAPLPAKLEGFVDVGSRP